MSLPRVLYFNNRGAGYGAETSLVELIRYLRRVEPKVVIPNSGSLGPRIKGFGTPTIHHQIPRVPEDGDHSHTIAATELDRILTENPAELLHLNKVFWHLPIAHKISADRGLKLVAHVRGEVDLDHEMLTSLAACDAVVAVSQAVRRHLLDSAACHRLDDALAQRLHVVTNGRTLAEYSPNAEHRRQVRRQLGISSEDVVVALFGYFDPLKGQDELVDIAAHMCPRHSQLRFLLVGGFINQAGERYRNRVTKRIRNLNLQSRVLSPGYLPASQCLSAVDIVLGLSRSEGFPGIMIEAMASGRAVVALAAGGTPEVIGPPECGFSIPVHDSQDVVEALDLLIRDSDLRERIACNARQRALANFGSERTAAAMEEIYESLC